MRITLVTCAFPPAVCGVGDYSERLALAFGERGHEVAVVASTIDAGGGSSERRGMTITRAARRWRGIGAALRVARAVRATRPERVIVQFSPYSHGRFGVAPFMPLLLALLRCLVRARVTVTFHELYLAWPGDAIGGRWRWLAQLSIAVAQRLQALLLIRCATDVVATTRARQRALGRIAKTRAVAMAPVGFAPPLVPLARTQRDELRRAWGAAASSFVVLTFGTVQACKRYEELIDAVAEVVRGGSDVRLVWIGDLTAAPANRMQALRQRIAGLGLQERVRTRGVRGGGERGCVHRLGRHLRPSRRWWRVDQEQRAGRSARLRRAGAGGRDRTPTPSCSCTPRPRSWWRARTARASLQACAP
ncbi:MAG: glycosyltransferase [Planctomycetota bacterium]